MEDPPEPSATTARATPREPHNPFYLLLLVVGVVFAINCVAYAVIPTIEDRAVSSGGILTPSPLREALRRDGSWWILGELVVITVLAGLSMGLDRWRSRKS